MRMRQFLFALAAAVLLAALATPAAGEKPPPPTPVGEIGVPDIEQTVEGDCGVRATVRVTSNVRSVLVHGLSAEFEDGDESVTDTVLLRKTKAEGTVVRLTLPLPEVPDPPAFHVTYDAKLYAETDPPPDGDPLDSETAVVDLETTCEPPPIVDPPDPELHYVTTSIGKGWTAWVEAINLVPYVDGENLSMDGQFGDSSQTSVDCEPSWYEEHHWRCEWTSPTFDKKTNTVLFRAYTDGGEEPVCSINIDRSSEFGYVLCP